MKVPPRCVAIPAGVFLCLFPGSGTGQSLPTLEAIEAQYLAAFKLAGDAEKHPVVGVSWMDAQAFCKWLSENEKLTYRLPTDREWSAAVGLGRKEKWDDKVTPQSVTKDQDEFPWGTEWPPPMGAGNYSDQSRKAKAPDPDAQDLEGYDDGFPTTAPVPSFAANKLGLYDLGGNVWEWVEDKVAKDLEERVLRGGSWCLAARRREGRARPPDAPGTCGK